ncbi:GSCFA domain-containing protein [Hymenobacter monticola]|uniref:GSCFA domain-containing protein n=1 Tax=Hymenobacter monticola TaxID=1705399 RepID=A0ABY4BBF2_9BACT|nr:GSCFA domain-containing protein [Hymenobacter monticola]UOE33985.1 GSCFA domain-containing protein [Hymenobacter monticola]
MFRTELSIAPATDQLARTARVLTMGSCFADSIGSRLLTNKVEALVNPFGTVFQPLAMAQLLRAAAGEDVDWQQHLVEARGRWQSYDMHGSIGAESPVELLQHIQELVRRTGEFVRSADVVLLTLGTAWAYRLRETGELVNNCHKQPADLFVRELLTPDEIINALAETHAYVRRINPKVRFVLTVSPVRHLKDTLPLNAVSKSVLRVATHIVSDLLPGVAYFPAYELLVDDLRDYRFYAADMLHPSEVAEDYIWEKFARTYFDAEFGRFRKEWASVRQSLGHRPLHEGAPEHRQFLESTLQKLEQLSLRRVEVSDELQTVRTRLAALPEPRQPEPEEEMDDDEERIDIGEGSKVSVVRRSDGDAAAVATAADAALADAAQPVDPENRPRLSPEEFRAQRAQRQGRPERGRRDGRGRNRQGQPAENEQFQAAEFAAEPADALAIMPEARAEAMAALEVDLTELATGPVAVDAIPAADVVDSPEPLKKKKRRSRGGAKRTARKHALRLAAEAENQVLSGAAPVENSAEPDSPAAAAADAAQADTAKEGKKSSVIVKSVPVKRGGRVPRVPSFAAPQEASAETSASVDAELLLPLSALPPVEAPEVVSEAAPTPLEPAVPTRRNNRNRKKNAPQGAGVVSVPLTETADVAAAEVSAPAAVIGTAEQLLGTEGTASASEANVPALAEESASTEATDAPSSNVSPTSARRAPRRAKARAVSGARTEKPAVDTPVVPVPDESRVRTQVAAGRMTGSSASLVTPAPPVEKPATTAKVKPAKAMPKAPAAKKPAASKVKAALLAPLPEVVAATLEMAPAPAELAAPETKPVAKAQKATKAPAKAPAKPKAPKKGADAEKPAVKPKAAKKPNKSAE